MTLKEATQLIAQSIQDFQESRERQAITDWILEDITGLKRVDRLLFDGKLDPAQEATLNRYAEALRQATPVQYVTGYAWFMGKKLMVDRHVLIPRPETEELVQWALSVIQPNMSIMDIGTGSGCIPILVKMEQPQTVVFGIDVSENALAVAQKNAAAFGTDIQFLLVDILDQSHWDQIPVVDIIISNPPYIPWMDKDSMDKHVVEHEPHLALFVPEEDPLVFYRAIIQLAESKLNSGGKIFFETHFALAGSVADLTSWPSEIREDAFGKQRMVCLTKP